MLRGTRKSQLLWHAPWRKETKYTFREKHGDLLKNRQAQQPKIHYPLSSWIQRAAPELSKRVG